MLLAEADESGRTIIDTGNDGCGSTGGDGGEILSAADFGEITALPVTADFAISEGFGGIGLAVDFKEASVSVGSRWTGEMLSGACSSTR